MRVSETSGWIGGVPHSSDGGDALFVVVSDPAGVVVVTDPAGVEVTAGHQQKTRRASGSLVTDTKS